MKNDTPENKRPPMPDNSMRLISKGADGLRYEIKMMGVRVLPRTFPSQYQADLYADVHRLTVLKEDAPPAKASEPTAGTPRCDAETHRSDFYTSSREGSYGEVKYAHEDAVSLDFARELERELAAEKGKLARTEMNLTGLQTAIDCNGDNARAALAEDEATALRARVAGLERENLRYETDAYMCALENERDVSAKLRAERDGLRSALNDLESYFVDIRDHAARLSITAPEETERATGRAIIIKCECGLHGLNALLTTAQADGGAALPALAARMDALLEAVQQIDAECQGALNNASPEDAPDIISNIRGISFKALKSAPSGAQSGAGEGWIEAEVRLPKDGEDVFFVRYGRVYRGTFNTIPRAVFASSSGMSYWHPKEGVTHWMPSPTPLAPVSTKGTP